AGLAALRGIESIVAEVEARDRRKVEGPAAAVPTRPIAAARKADDRPRRLSRGPIAFFSLLVKTTIGVSILVALLLGAAAVIALYNGTSLPGLPARNRPIEDDVTMGEYRGLRPGMSYFEVRDAIGKPGEEAASSRLDGIPGVMPATETKIYRWVNADGSN